MNENGRPKLEPISEFGKALKDYLEHIGKNYKMFAFECGFNKSMVSTWIRGQRKRGEVAYKCYPSYPQLLKIVKTGHSQFVFKCLEEGIL